MLVALEQHVVQNVLSSVLPFGWAPPEFVCQASHAVCTAGGEFEQSVADMLHAGFEQQSCIYLRRRIQVLCLQKLEEMRKKFKIECPHSRRLTIVYDQSGAL